MISAIVNDYITSIVSNVVILGSMWFFYKDTRKTQERQDDVAKKQSEDIEFNTKRLREFEESTTSLISDSKNLIESFENLQLSLDSNEPDPDLNKEELIEQFSDRINDFKSGFLLNSDKISNIHEILSDHEENIRQLHKRFDQDIVKEKWVFPN
jgi:hypothetical protein